MNRRVIHSVCCLVIVLGLSACTSISSKNASLSRVVEKFVKESDLSGLAVTVGTADKIIWSQGFGYADLEQSVAIDPSRTKFRVGSTAKSMTAAALGQLHESGKIDLDAPIQAYLPDFPQKSGTITSRLLAGHLAGIRHYANDEFLSAASYQSVTGALSIFANDPLLFLPGTQFGYSTYGYNLLSAVIERAAGQAFLDYMVKNVFGPAGMDSTVPDRVTPLIQHRSRYYTKGDNGLVNAPWVDNSNKWAGGGFLSTSEDLIRFGQAHLSDKLIHPRTIEMLWTSQQTLEGAKTGYGIGWFITVDDANRRVVRHSGGSVGGITELRIYPDHGLVIAVVTNTAPANLGPLVVRVAEEFLTR